MSFVVSARTILQLGAELISSDAVALYELIKNAIDARSKSGVQVEFEIVIREADFASAISQAELPEPAPLAEIKAMLLEKIQSRAPETLKTEFRNAVEGSRSVASLVKSCSQAYASCNRIIVSDTGHGMSLQDLKTIFLTIGTSHRTTGVLQAVAHGDKVVPYLGEKGVGRLSVMRLGRRLLVETATASDRHVNILEIDWRLFEEAFDKPASSIKIEPRVGGRKPLGESFTRMTVSDLRSSWSERKLAEISRDQIARMLDPFSWASKRRFQIKLLFNGEPIDQARTVAQELLKHAHAHCVGEFSVDPKPSLKVTFTSSLYAGPPTTHTFDVVDLMAMSTLKEAGYTSSVLKALGPFDFEFFWFNRQRIKLLEGIGDREAVRGLIRTWSGVSLFRDGYRVLPYGDQGDDWLGLDREALSASGYKLNTKQIIGRVRIGRATNPKLLDQTNRQGLTGNIEKESLVALLNSVISDWWRAYLNEASNVQKRATLLDYEPAKETAVVASLEARTSETIRTIRRDFKGDAQLLQQVKDAFVEIQDAYARAIQRIETIEEQKERLTQLAGIGLMIEMIAHELTRATEATEATLRSLKPKKFDEATQATFRVLGQQIKVIHKRLQTLEPLSISGRTRRSHMNLHDIVRYIMESHAAQFERHEINGVIDPKSDRSAVAFVVEGHVVQILENLIHNSVYWLDLQRQEHRSFKPMINIEVLSGPPRILFTDNGPGIPENRAEIVFEPFFSTKSGTKSRRQGLGLHIARQNAEMLGGTLSLVEDQQIRRGRLNTFELLLKESSS